MNRRNGLLALPTLCAMARAAVAQQAPRMPMIGFLHPGAAGTAQRPSTTLLALQAGLQSQGYVDGQSIRVETRYAEGKPERLSALAQEFVQLKVDLLVAVALPSIQAARAATRDVPIVALDLETDPVASGLVASLPKPGGNLTGLFSNHADLAAKWLQLIAETIPAARRMAVLWDVSVGTYQVEAIKAAAAARSVQLAVHEFNGSEGLLRALDASLKSKPGAVLQLGSPLVNQASKATARALAAQRMPGISPFREFADQGGLLSYGVNQRVMYRSLAIFIAKVLRGARPGDLAIEQPTHFELVINLQAAKAFGLTLPSSLLVRADEVIQ